MFYNQYNREQYYCTPNLKKFTSIRKIIIDCRRLLHYQLVVRHTCFHKDKNAHTISAYSVCHKQDTKVIISRMKTPLKVAIERLMIKICILIEKMYETCIFIMCFINVKEN